MKNSKRVQHQQPPSKQQTRVTELSDEQLGKVQGGLTVRKAGGKPPVEYLK
jgi:hypothetical protein